MADRTCPKCNMVFIFPSVLRAHMKNSFHCLSNNEEIENHINTNKKDNTNNIKCKFCNSAFTRNADLTRHNQKSACGKIQIARKIEKEQGINKLTIEQMKLLYPERIDILLGNIVPIRTIPIPSIPLPAIPPSAIPETPATPLPVAIPLPPQNMEGIYLVHTREFVNSNKPIYKIGRSSNIVNRTKQYPNGSNVICMLCCENSVECEAKLIELFKVKFTQETFYGKEYFSGNKYDMIKQIFNYISSRYEISF